MLGCKGFIEGVNPKKKRKQFVVKASNAPFEKQKERLPWRYIKQVMHLLKNRRKDCHGDISSLTVFVNFNFCLA